MDEIQEKNLVIRDRIKYLSDKLLTFAIEVECGQPLERMNLEKINEISQMGGKTKKQYTYSVNNKLVYDVTDAAQILGMLCSKKQIDVYVRELVELNDENDSLSKVELTLLLQRELGYINDLRRSRNSIFGHNTSVPDWKQLEDWMRIVKSYISFFRNIKFDIWKKFDVDRYYEDDWKENYLEELDDEANQISCELARNLNVDDVCYTFRKVEYRISKDNYGDFNLLITEMARYWFQGFEYIKSDSDNALERFIQKRYEESTGEELRRYRVFREDLRLVRLDHIKQDMEINIAYMQLLYILNPELVGFYWLGKRYLEGEFAAKVLQTLTRHDSANNLEEKIETLIYRINHFSEWKEAFGKGNSRPGIEIDIIGVAKKKILSRYFSGKQFCENLLCNQLKKMLQMSEVEKAEYLKEYDYITEIVEITDTPISVYDGMLAELSIEQQIYVFNVGVQSTLQWHEKECDRLKQISEKAKRAENSIIEIASHDKESKEWFTNNYTKLICSIYELSCEMRKRYTYRDKLGNVFNNRNEFITRVLYNQEAMFMSLKEMTDYINVISKEESFDCWLRHV